MPHKGSNPLCRSKGGFRPPIRVLPGTRPGWEDHTGRSRNSGRSPRAKGLPVSRKLAGDRSGAACISEIINYRCCGACRGGDCQKCNRHYAVPEPTSENHKNFHTGQKIRLVFSCGRATLAFCPKRATHTWFSPYPIGCTLESRPN
jgi:hypothetical protein